MDLHGKRLINNFKDFFWLGRLDDDVVDATCFGELPGLLLDVTGGIKNYRCVRDLAIKAQFSHEFVAIHLRHENVGNDKVGFFIPRHFERLRPTLRLKQAMTAVFQQRHENPPIGRAIIDNEDSFHGLNIAAASVHPTGAEITCFGCVKSRKSRPGKTPLVVQRVSIRAEANALPLKTARQRTTIQGWWPNRSVKRVRPYWRAKPIRGFARYSRAEHDRLFKLVVSLIHASMILFRIAKRTSAASESRPSLRMSTAR